MLIFRTHTKFVWKNKMLALGVYFPQPSWGDGRRFAEQDHVEITTNHFVRFHKDEFNEMLRKLNFTAFPRSFGPNPTLPQCVGQSCDHGLWANYLLIETNLGHNKIRDKGATAT